MKAAAAIEMAETKVVTTETIDGSQQRSTVRKPEVLPLRRVERAQVALRLLCLMTTVVAVVMMVLAKEDANIIVYGFELPVHSKWSFSNSFERHVTFKSLVIKNPVLEYGAFLGYRQPIGLGLSFVIGPVCSGILSRYLVGVSAAVAAHSLLQLLIGLSRLWRRSPLIPSRGHAWLMLAGDQVFAYAMMSAGSAASGVTNLNRTGVKHTALPKFCNSLHSFCDHVAVSIVFTFIGCFLLTVSVMLDVIWLSKH